MSNVLPEHIVRPYRESDYRQLAGLLELCGLFDEYNNRPEILAHLNSVRPGATQVIDSQNRIVGCGTAGDMVHPVISQLGVHPDYRGRMLSGKIIDALCNVLAKAGFSHAELWHDAKNRKLFTHYNNLGFIPTDVCVLMVRPFGADVQPAENQNFDFETLSTPVGAFDYLYEISGTAGWPHRQPVSFISQWVGGFEYNGAITNSKLDIPGNRAGRPRRSWVRLHPTEQSQSWMNVMRHIDDPDMPYMRQGWGIYVVRRPTGQLKVLNVNDGPFTNWACSSQVEKTFDQLVSDAKIVSASRPQTLSRQIGN